MERQVIVAKSAGFCFGVERAVERVYEQIKAVNEGKAQGPIILMARSSTMKKWSVIWKKRESGY